MRCEHARDDAVYVLGALCPSERTTFERHMAECASCRDSVAEFAVLPGLLARLDPVTAERVVLDVAADREAPDVDAEPSRLQRLFGAAASVRRRDRRRRRTVNAVLAAACVAALVGLGAVLAIRPGTAPIPRGPVALASMEPARESSGNITAEVGLTPVAGGTFVRLHCVYSANSDHRASYGFQLVAYGTDGRSEQVMSWRAGPGDALSVDGMTRLTPEQLDRVELQQSDGDPVLVYVVA